MFDGSGYEKKNWIKSPKGFLNTTEMDMRKKMDQKVL